MLLLSAIIDAQIVKMMEICMINFLVLRDNQCFATCVMLLDTLKKFVTLDVDVELEMIIILIPVLLFASCVITRGIPRKTAIICVNVERERNMIKNLAKQSARFVLILVILLKIVGLFVKLVPQKANIIINRMIVMTSNLFIRTEKEYKL